MAMDRGSLVGSLRQSDERTAKKDLDHPRSAQKMLYYAIL